MFVVENGALSRLRTKMVKRNGAVGVGSVRGIWFCDRSSRARRKICRVEVRRDLVGGMKRDHPHVGKCEV